MTLANHPDPSQTAQTASWEVAGSGIVNPQVLQLAKALGLRAVPPMTPTLAYLGSLLRRYGPLWTNGRNHIVVIGGIDEPHAQLKIFDPWPLGKGKIEWRPFSWYLSGGAPDTRDTSRSVEAVFLYHP